MRATRGALVEKAIADKDCDDHHIIAIVRISGCRLICSNDKRADRYIKDRRLTHARAAHIDLPK